MGNPNLFPDNMRIPKTVTEARREFASSLLRAVRLEQEKLGGQACPFEFGYSDFEEYARRRLWITDKRARLVRFEVNNIQRKILATKQATVDAGKLARFLVLKYRRAGVSTLEQGLSYQMVDTQPRTNVITIGQTAEDTEAFFEMPLLMHSHDPEARATPPRGNKRILEFPSIGSKFRCLTAGKRGLGRGATFQRVHGSEVTLWHEGQRNRSDKQDETIVGLTEAASHGEVTLESTPRGEDWFARTYRDAKAGLNDWTPIFLPWFADEMNVLPVEDESELRDTLTDEEEDLVSKHGLTMQQLAWRRSKKRGMRLFVQEYPEDDEACFLTSGTTFFDVERVMELRRKVPEYKTKHVAGGTYVEWEPPQKGVQYVIGSDTSEGIPGRDPNGYGVMRFDTGAQVAMMHGVFRPDVLAKHIHKAHLKWNKAFVGIERQNHGHAVLGKLADLGLRHPKYLYHYKKGRSGWSTDATTRPVMLDEFSEWLCTADISQIRDRDMLGECLTFHLQSNGKWEHDSSAHDDRLFMWAIALQVRRRRPRAPRML